MQLFYHSSMITKVYAAFTVEVKNAERIPDLKNVINTIAMHRLENTKIGNGADETMTPATEVAATIVAAMASSNLRDSFESVQALPFNLDTLNNKDIENTYATMMQYGRYMPLMIPAKKSMISDKNQIMVAVLGIGEHPDTDFTIIVIDVQKMLRSLCLPPVRAQSPRAERSPRAASACMMRTIIPTSSASTSHWVRSLFPAPS